MVIKLEIKFQRKFKKLFQACPLESKKIPAQIDKTLTIAIPKEEYISPERNYN